MSICSVSSSRLETATIFFNIFYWQTLFVDLWKSAQQKNNLKSAFVSHIDNLLSSAAENPTTQCTVHQQCISSGLGITQFPMYNFTNHYHLVVNLDFSSNSLETLPSDFFSSFISLRALNLSNNKLSALPTGIGLCSVIEAIDVSLNRLSNLPQDFGDASKSLQVLNISNNPLFHLHDCVLSGVLKVLHAENIGIKELPDGIGQLSSLTILNLGGNALTKLPSSFANLLQLTSLDLSGVHWLDTQDTKTIMTHNSFNDFMRRENPLLAQIDKEVNNYLTVKLIYNKL